MLVMLFQMLALQVISARLHPCARLPACCLQVRAGTWEGGHEKRATQYFEVMHQLTGSKIVKYFVMVIVIISLLCTGIAQIIAIATGMYYLKDTISKRSERLPLLCRGLMQARNPCQHALDTHDICARIDCLWLHADMRIAVQ